MVPLQQKDPLEVGTFGEEKGNLRGKSYHCYATYKCVALWRAVYGASATERPLGSWNFS